MTLQPSSSIQGTPAPTQGAVGGSSGAWRLAWGARGPGSAARRGWSRYEKLSFQMLFWMFGMMMGMTLALHVFNYHLETKTSSTSGTHRSFYGLHGASPSASPSTSTAGGATAPARAGEDAAHP